MRNTAKLLPVLLLGSALGGCSMAGTGDFFADEYAHTQQTQMPHYWGQASGCAYTGCEVAYPTAPSQVATHAYGSQAYGNQGCGNQAYLESAPVLPSYGQQACGGQPYGNPAYAAPSYGGPSHGEPIYNGAQYGGPAHVGSLHNGHGVSPAPHAYAQAVPNHLGHQGHYYNGHAPAYVPSHAGSRRGLRQAYTYGSLGATLYDVDSDLYGVQGRAGWQSKSFFGAEVEGSLGFNDDESTLEIGNTLLSAESGIDSQLAGFGVARLPLSERLNILGRVGYHNTEFSAVVTDGFNTQDVEFSTDGIAYGLGAEYAIGERTSLRADYTRYDFDGADADAVSLAIARKF